MRTHVVFKGLKKLNKQLDKLQKDIDAPALQALGQSALVIHGHAVKSIQERSPGEIEIINGRRVQRSKPGDPPNTQTGRLVKSIRWVLNKSLKMATVGSRLNYAFFLEFGTSKMAARPWLRPAFLKNKKLIGELYARTIQRAIKGVAK